MCMDEFGAVMAPLRPVDAHSPAYRGRQQDSTGHEEVEDYGLGRKLMLARIDQVELTPRWCQDQRGDRVSQPPMFRDACALRRCIVSVDGFFEWREIKGARAKQLYATTMKGSSPFLFAA